MPVNDYLSLVLTNMSAGLLVLGAYFLWGLCAPNSRAWCAGFAIVGLAALVLGLHLTLTWPFHGKVSFANVAFGEMTVMFGVAYLGAALAIGRQWPLHAVALYGMVAGVAAIVIGIRFIQLHATGTADLTASPPMTGAGFVLTGLLGVVTLPVVLIRTKPLRALGAILCFLAGGLWGYVGMMAYWGHLLAASKLA